MSEKNYGKIIREKLAERARNIPLYLHAYAFHLNMRYERILPEDLLDIAHQHHLKGVKVHVEEVVLFTEKYAARAVDV
jgi:hypothetical protein